MKDALIKYKAKENHSSQEGGKTGKNKTDVMPKKKTFAKNSEINSFIDDDISSIQEMSDEF